MDDHRRGAVRRALTPKIVGAAALLAAGPALLAGCGGGSEASTTAASAPSTVIPQPEMKLSSTGNAASVASVEGTPIAKASYEHWLAVDRALGVTDSPQHHALGFLISSSWVLGEAAKLGISVSEREVHTRLAALEKQSFPEPGQLKRYLAKSHQTRADLLARVRVELLQGKISEQVAGKSTSKAAHEAALASYQKRFAAHWKAVTTCKRGYVMEDCKEYKGAPEPEAETSSGPSKANGSSAGPSSSGGATSSSPSGEVSGLPKSFSISSPAFERNGQIPAKYTCAGAGVSPPLQWSRVPKGASELVLFVIDDTSSGSEGGIRWVLGGIDPASTGVEAGETPSGAIVGTNTSGKKQYSPICPGSGKTDTIEFVMYALKKPIKLSAGFQPSAAESEYGSTKDLLGEAAVTYGVASGR